MTLEMLMGTGLAIMSFVRRKRMKIFYNSLAVLFCLMTLGFVDVRKETLNKC
jgi:hypothetical protein